MHRACENSLRRLQTDYLDMYLLHWRGDIPLQETVEAMEKLVAEGKIRRWGVSNLDTEDMQALWRTADGEHCATNQCSTISHRGALNTISCPRVPAAQSAGDGLLPAGAGGALTRWTFSA